MSRRTGVTLVEVLIAIFVMGIGLIALLTLFPIGILRMGLAIHQQRSADSARNADAVAIFQNIRNDLSTSTSPGVGNVTAAWVTAHGSSAYDGNSNNDLFANPWPANGSAIWKPAATFGESYPIFVDPIGYYSVSNGSLSQHWVAGYQGVLRRRPVSFANNGALVTSLYTNFTFWDDITFNAANDPSNGLYPGTPQVSATTLLRDSRFSWGYTMRRPTTSDKSVVDSSIVVFDTRSLSASSQGSLPESVYAGQAYFNPLSSTITVDYSSTTANPIPPSVRAGDWILDVTPIPPTDNAGKILWSSIQGAHAYWYRVVATDDLVVGGKSLTRYEVQQPIRGFALPSGYVAAQNAAYPPSPLPNSLPYNAADPTVAGAAQLTVYQGTVVILDGVAAVYEKGPARLP